MPVSATTNLCEIRCCLTEEHLEEHSRLGATSQSRPRLSCCVQTTQPQSEAAMCVSGAKGCCSTLSSTLTTDYPYDHLLFPFCRVQYLIAANTPASHDRQPHPPNAVLLPTPCLSCLSMLHAVAVANGSFVHPVQDVIRTCCAQD